jgi:hypothetical protein
VTRGPQLRGSTDDHSCERQGKILRHSPSVPGTDRTQHRLPEAGAIDIVKRTADQDGYCDLRTSTRTLWLGAVASRSRDRSQSRGWARRRRNPGEQT